MVKVISEIVINHNGSLELCKELIMTSKVELRMGKTELRSIY